jgi:chemotaxis methyl-accepting protein methylase
VIFGWTIVIYFHQKQKRPHIEGVLTCLPKKSQMLLGTQDRDT